MTKAVPLRAFRKDQPQSYRRALVVAFLLALALLPTTVANFDSQSLGRGLPLLIALAVIFFCAHGLFSNAYNRNRLLARPERELDEYELHERNAIYAAVFRRTWWLPLLMLGLASIGSALVPLLGVEAPEGMALLDAMLLAWVTFIALPRLVLAWTYREE